VEIVAELGPNGETVPIPAVVSAIQARTGRSRATAYHEVADAMASGVIKRHPQARAETTYPAVGSGMPTSVIIRVGSTL
jgi:hypothetical protein